MYTSHNNNQNNGIYKTEWKEYKNCILTKLKKKPNTYKSNLATYAINIEHEFPDIHKTCRIVRHCSEHLGKATYIQK